MCKVPNTDCMYRNAFSKSWCLCLTSFDVVDRRTSCAHVHVSGTTLLMSVASQTGLSASIWYVSRRPSSSAKAFPTDTVIISTRWLTTPTRVVRGHLLHEVALSSRKSVTRNTNSRQFQWSNDVANIRRIFCSGICSSLSPMLLSERLMLEIVWYKVELVQGWMKVHGF